MIPSRYGLAWLTARGYNINGNINDGLTAYLQAKTGSTADKNSMFYNYLGTLGFTQATLNDRLIALWASRTGLPASSGFTTLSNAFYANTVLDYAISVAAATTGSPIGLLLMITAP